MLTDKESKAATAYLSELRSDSEKQGYADGWRAACEALAEWHEEQRKFWSEPPASPNSTGAAVAHIESTVECRRRAGEQDGEA